MIIVPRHYDQINQRVLCSFSNGSKVIMLRWIRGRMYKVGWEIQKLIVKEALNK